MNAAGSTRRRALLGLAALLACPSLARGHAFPRIDVRSATGVRLTESALHERATVLEWASPHCPISRSRYDLGIIPALQAGWRSFGRWWTVFPAAPGQEGFLCGAEAERWIAARGGRPHQLVVDAAGALGRAFAAPSTPFAVVTVPDRGVVYRGAIDSAPSYRLHEVRASTTRAYLEECLAAVRSGRDPPLAETTPFGCAIVHARAGSGSSRECGPA